MSNQRPQHPSGKPVRNKRVVGKSWTNIPATEPLTPGLRVSVKTEAIGFTVPFFNGDSFEPDGKR